MQDKYPKMSVVNRKVATSMKKGYDTGLSYVQYQQMYFNKEGLFLCCNIQEQYDQGQTFSCKDTSKRQKNTSK